MPEWRSSLMLLGTLAVLDAEAGEINELRPLGLRRW
jgi:hypothetical protein